MKLRFVVMSVAAAVIAPLFVHAQNTEAATETDVSKEEPVVLPEFSISAAKDTGYVGKSSLSSTRIAVDIADLPQSVKVLNNSFLKAVNPFNMSDVLNYTGGAQNGALNWTPGRLAIRGFSGDGDYTDSFAPTAASVVDSAVFERFEVIKGPSTIFLAADGSPGGLINKITKSPLSTQTTTLSTQFGLYDANRVSLDSTGPVPFVGGKKLLYRIVGAMQYSNGYYDATYMHRLTLMPALSYQFNDNTKLEVKALLVNTLWPSYNGLMLDPRTLRIWDVPYTRSASEDYPYNWRHDYVRRVWGSFTSRLTDWVALRVSSMYAYDRANRQESLANTWNDGGRRWNTATSPTTYTGGPYPRTTTADDQFNTYKDIQADLNFNFRTGFANHNFLLGGEIRNNPNFQYTYAGTSSPWDPFNKTTPTVVANWINKTGYTYNTDKLNRVYALENLKIFNDRVILSYGVTRSSSTRSTQNKLTGVYNPAEYTVDKNLKQYGAVFKLVDGVSLFYGYNENFALNGVGLRNGVSGPLPPKTGKQHEIGVKTTLLNKKLTANISYFDVQQQNNTVPSSPLDPLNPNVLVPGVISRGFDGDLTYQANRNLYLMASFSLFDAKSVLGPAAATFVQPYTNTIITGSIPVDNISERSWSLIALYRFTDGPLNKLNLSIGANSLAKRAITDNANQVWFGYVPGRTLVNLNATYRLDKHWNFGLNIDNLFDKKYIYSVRSVNVIVPGPSINVKGSIDYTF
jgi:iron complex outermembrane receptor protein